MIGYVTLGVSDMAKAKQFYTDLLSDLGAKVLMDMGRIAFIGESMKSPMLAVCEPYDGKQCTAGNGAMVAFSAGSKEAVDSHYQKAIALGATDEGEPGQRIKDRFYGAYVRDPDGNKIAFYYFG
ncbi:VOC family protein [Allohahella marinimesophila]|uniref:VOC family protein n=1 Tax=Allohahella marinimesophila TaxID=1054972 RepID=A0ABP7NG71_9GAMM